MNDPLDAHNDLHDDERVIDALLRERFGGAVPPALADAVLVRHARGDGAAAAARLHAATATPEPIALPLRRRSWLAFAAALLGVFGVLSALLWRDGAPGAGGGGEHAVTPQDPQPPTVVPVCSLEELRALLPQVTAVEFEVLRLEGTGFTIATSGAPTLFPVDDLAALFAEAEVVDPAGWQWSNCIRLRLPEQRVIELALDWNGKFRRARVGLRGLHGDLSVGGKGMDRLFAMAQPAWRAAQIRAGLVTSADDLDGKTALPADAAMLRLFHVEGDGLLGLRRFTNLRRLDLSGLNATLRPEDLTAIARLDNLQQSLRELCLDGCQLADRDLVALLPLVHLQRLELRRVARVRDRLELMGPAHPRRQALEAQGRFTGEGFRVFTNSSRRRDGPTEVDLSGCALTDEGLAAITLWSPPHLVLDGAGERIGQAGWFALMTQRTLQHLDLTEWTIDASRARDLASRTDLQTLVLRRSPPRLDRIRDCGIEDAILAILQATSSPLRKIDLRGHTALTDAAVTAFAAKFPGIEVQR